MVVEILINTNLIKFSIRYFFVNRRNLYTYIALGILLLVSYFFILFVLHDTNDNIPRPFHVITYNLDYYYRWVYWFLVPFVLITSLLGNLQSISIYIQIRINNPKQLLFLYIIQLSIIAFWGTLLIGIITFACFPLASKTITANDVLNISFLLIFCFLNLINIGLLVTILAKKFSREASFIIVFLLTLCDQYVLGHFLFSSTKLLYRPGFSLFGTSFALLENILLLIGLLLVLTDVIRRKEE